MSLFASTIINIALLLICMFEFSIIYRKNKKFKPPSHVVVQNKHNNESQENKIKEDTGKLLSCSMEISSSTENIEISMDQIQSASNAVINNQNEQIKDIKSISDLNNGINDEIQKSFNNVEKIMNDSIKAKENIDMKKEDILKSVSEFKKLEGLIGETQNDLSKLSDRNKDIGSMISMVENISSQTNLLALNAAIEAARAGEEGKGFSVVAAEVKKLSQQTKDVISKITSLMKESNISVSNTVDHINNIMNTISYQGNNLNQITRDINQIKISIESCVEGISQIKSEDKNLLNNTKDASAFSQKVITTVDSNEASLENVFSAINDEAKSISELNSLISNFEIEIGDLYKKTDENENDENKDTLIFITAPYEPFIIDNGSELTGIDVDIIKEIYKKNNINVEIKKSSFDTSLKMIKNKVFDATPTISYSEERNSYMNFSDSYRDNSRLIFIKNKNSNKKIESYKDISKYKIGLLKGFNYNSKFSNDSNIKKQYCNDIKGAMQKLLKEQIDFVLINAYQGNYFIKQNNMKDLVDTISFKFEEKDGTDTRIGFKKESSMEKYIKMFNEGFKEIKKNGTLSKIEKKYI